MSARLFVNRFNKGPLVRDYQMTCDSPRPHTKLYIIITQDQVSEFAIYTDLENLGVCSHFANSQHQGN